MDKRRKFVLATLVISGLFFVSQLVPFSWRYRATLGLISLAGLYLWLLFRQLAREKQNALAAILLPLSFVAGIAFFYFIFSQNLIWRAGLLLAFTFGLYTILLAENVFVVAREFKAVPLYRAASTSGLLMMLTSAFFLFDTIFSFRFSAWTNGLIVFLTAGVLWLHFFWATTLTPLFNQNSLTMAVIFSLIIAEISVIISFWPVGVGKGSLYLVSLLYVFSGLAQAYCRQRLFKKTIWEYIWVGLGTFLALFLVTSWRGN